MTDLQARLSALPPDRRAVVVRLLAERRSAGDIPPIPVDDDGSPAPLSASQEQMWFLYQVDPIAPAYNNCNVLQVTGSLRADLLARCVRHVVARHSALRTTFESEDGQVRQVVHPRSDVQLEVEDLRDVGVERRDAALQRRIDVECRRPFDLTLGPVARFRLVRLTDEDHIFIAVFHHIVVDGWSMQLLMADVVEAYELLLDGREPEDREPLLSYRAFARWQHGWLESSAYEASLAAVRARMRGVEALALPTTDAPPTHGASRYFDLSSDVTDGLRAIARDERTSLYVILLAGFVSVLSRWTNQAEILVGSPVAGRTQAELQDVVGFFANLVPIRASVSGDPLLVDVARGLHAEVAAAFEHQAVPFDRVVDAVRAKRAGGEVPLVKALFTLQPTVHGQVGGLDIEPLEIDNGTAKFPLAVGLTERDGRLRGAVQYWPGVLDAGDIDRFVDRLIETWTHWANGQSLRLSDLTLTVGAGDNAVVALAATNSQNLDAVRERFSAQPTAVYVRDRFGDACSVGVVGEVHLDPATETPGPPQLARYQAGGGIDWLGPHDRNVQIGLARVSLLEVEAAVQTHPSVERCTVEVRRSGDVEELVASVTTRSSLPMPKDLRTHVALRVPAAGVPDRFVAVDADPADDVTSAADGPEGAEPLPDDEGTAVEAMLTRVWCDVLGLGNVDVDDNFFELGGDSILAMQVVGKVQALGLSVAPRQLLENQTIASLAEVATLGDPTAEQGPVTGVCDLTPIQQWLFEQDDTDPSHFNMGVLLTVEEPLDRPALERAIGTVLAHHDVLRARFHRHDGADVTCNLAGLDGAVGTVDEIDLAGVDDHQLSEDLATAIAAVHESFDLADGDLIRVTRISLGRGRGERLLIVIHHLVVDGVSWRVIMDDLLEAYRQTRDMGWAQLQPKTTSFATYTSELSRLAATGHWDDEFDWWLSQGGACTIPVDDPAGSRSESSSATVSQSLDREATRTLLRQRAGSPSAGDALVAAVALAVASWADIEKVRLDLEGHGRDPAGTDLDISRTVGWFTAVYPVNIDVDPGAVVDDRVRRVSEHLARVPGGGVGFGWLRCAGAPAIRRALGDLPEAPIGVNYLGQFDQILDNESPVLPAPEGPGPMRDPDSRRPHELEVVGHVADGRLTVTLSYSTQRHHAETAERLLVSVMRDLRDLADRWSRDQEAPTRPSLRERWRGAVQMSATSSLGGVTEQFWHDATLDLTIDNDRDHADPTTGSILLTGATTSLGSAVARHLIRETERSVWCVVPSPALPVVLSHLEADAPLTEEQRARLHLVAGRVTRPGLDLPPRVYDDLAAQVGLVIHAAETVSRSLSYGTLRPVNVTGVREVLRLAATGRPKRFALTSTLSVHDPRGRPVPEPGSVALHESFVDGYSQSKWVAERLVEVAAGYGLDATVIRVAEILPDAGSPAAVDGRLMSFLRDYARIGLVPRPALHVPVDVVTLTDAARQLVEAATTDPPRLHHHVTGSAPVRLGEFIRSLSAAGHPIAATSSDAFRAAVHERPPTRSFTGMLVERIAIAALRARPPYRTGHLPGRRWGHALIDAADVDALVRNVEHPGETLLSDAVKEPV